MSMTLIFILLCGILSYICFNNAELFHKLKHWPYAVFRYREHYRLISSGFIHGSWLHLLINMFVLYMFGEAVEWRYKLIFGDHMGRMYFALLFLATVILADIPSLIKHKDNPYYSAVGASGAVSGIVFTFILFQPWELLYLYGIIPVPGIIMGIAYLWYSSWASKHSRDNIDHDAHFYGALFGIIITIILHPPMLVHFLKELTYIPYF